LLPPAVLRTGYPPSGGGLTALVAGKRPKHASPMRSTAVVFLVQSVDSWFFLSFPQRVEEGHELAGM
jgi:hypothetical protein